MFCPLSASFRFTLFYFTIYTLIKPFKSDWNSNQHPLGLESFSVTTKADILALGMLGHGGNGTHQLWWPQTTPG